jgi:hypothetical protein
MATIINIRGTGGSGKSFTVHYLIKKFGIKNDVKKDGKVVGYRLNGDVMVVGRYDTTCGGTDQIKTQDGISDRVTKFAKMGKVVIYEGLLASTLYGRYLDLSRRLTKQGHKVIWSFLDTPIEKCIKRTIRRREKRGNTKLFNEKHTVEKFKAVASCKRHALVDKINVVDLKHQKAHKQLLKLVKKYV